MTLNQQLESYFKARVFDTEQQLDEFLTAARVFRYTKFLYFDEVENANAWSFSLVDRDLHHTFEEYIISRGLPPYAIWSSRNRETVDDDIGRATFPISEIAAMYRKPVPRAGDEISYIMEVLSLEDRNAVLGFLGFLAPLAGKRSLSPSVASAWLRVFVKYDKGGDDRYVTAMPIRFREALETSLAKDFKM